MGIDLPISMAPETRARRRAANDAEPDLRGRRDHALRRARQRLERQLDGLVRIALKRAYNDGTLAVDMDPLSLLFRLAMSVPPPRSHTVKDSGVLASASR